MIDNHRILDSEYEDFKNALSKMKNFLNINTTPVDFSETEAKLGVELPRELKLLYTAISNHEEYFTTDIRLLRLDELYIDNDIIVVIKKKRTPVSGIDIKTGCQAFYIKKNWEIYPGDESCYLSWISNIFCTSLETKSVIRKGRIKGNLCSTLNLSQELKERLGDKFNILEEYHTYTNVIVYSDNGTLAMVRSNGFYGDIHVGSDNEAEIELLGELLKEVSWK